MTKRSVTGKSTGLDRKMEIKKYRSSDRQSIVKCMERFGDYLAAVDGMQRARRMPGYGEWFTGKMLEAVDKNSGLIYVVENDGQIVGFIAGVIRAQSTQELLESIPTKAGRIIELLVDQEFRRQGIGTRLMQMMEEYSRQNGCDVSRVDVFEPNVKAHHFYRKLGYQDRMIDMIKML